MHVSHKRARIYKTNFFTLILKNFLHTPLKNYCLLVNLQRYEVWCGISLMCFLGTADGEEGWWRILVSRNQLIWMHHIFYLLPCWATSILLIVAFQIGPFDFIKTSLDVSSNSFFYDYGQTCSSLIKYLKSKPFWSYPCRYMGSKPNS